MKYYYPDYYDSFRCIADKCKHNCCIGWEIDIDSDTLEYYNSLTCDFAKRLQNGIRDNSFLLDENDRCVFLNKNGLCDIISKLGEDALCDICRDHPRFRNFYTDRVEIGLGLCCEEAARIILSNPNPISLKFEEYGQAEFPTDEEAELLSKRDKIISILQNRALPFYKRVENIRAEFGIKMPSAKKDDIISLYSSLERLDANWDNYLGNLSQTPTNGGFELDSVILEQLCVYFVFRHLADSLSDGKFKQRLAFCLHATEFIESLCAADNAIEPITFDKICDICRMYSAEIEYSDENLNRLLNSNSICGG